MSGLAYTAGFVSPSAASAKPHYVGYTVARTVAADQLFSIWNGATAAAIRFCVDLDGKPYSKAWTAGDLPYIAAGAIANVARMDTLAVGTAGQVLRVNAGATAPEWASDLSLTFLAASGARITGLSVPTAGKGLEVNFVSGSPDTAVLQGYNRDTTAYTNVVVYGNTINLVPQDATSQVVIGYGRTTNGLLIYTDAAAGIYAGLCFRTPTNQAQSATGTLTNAPVAGNPKFWLPVNINGALASIPCW